MKKRFSKKSFRYLKRLRSAFLLRNYNGNTSMSRFTTDSKIWSSGASGARTLKELEQANADLKKQLAESVLDNETIKATLNRKY